MNPRLAACAGLAAMGGVSIVLAAQRWLTGGSGASAISFACIGVLGLAWAALIFAGVNRVFSAAARLQEGRKFKLFASGVVVAVGLGALGTYIVQRTAPQDIPDVPADAMPDVSALDASARAEMESALSAVDRIRDRIARGRESTGTVAIATFASIAIALVVVWLGLALTYLLIGSLAILAGLPLALLGGEGSAWMVVGIVWLTAAFTALMRALSMALSGPGPVLAIARNVLAEAARMKLSLVLIVMLILGLSLLPSLLREDVFLRYRVQTFLQYSVSGSFWIMAVLTLFFAVSSVAFEQRDRLIWQTMTKPVAAWEYILGKWVGIAGLNLVLLAVSATAIFLFVEYLRAQPAGGESRERASLVDSELSQDRRILETQVLTARVEIEHTPPWRADDEAFLQSVQAYVEEQVKAEPGFDTSPENIARVRAELLKSANMIARAIPPAANPSAAVRTFLFEGLESARDDDAPLTIHYRVNAGSNMPDQLYKMSFEFPGAPPIERDTGLAQRHSFTATPFLHDPSGQTVLLAEVPPSAAAAAVRAGFPLVTANDVIDGEGRLPINVYNGRFVWTEQGLAFAPNREIANIPDNGLAVSYEGASFQENFLRIVAVMWLKLAFLAIAAIAASTFLSFPVACLVSFGVFIMAEGSGFLEKSLEYYGTTDRLGNLDLGQAIIFYVGSGIVGTFRTYEELKPTTRLVEGRLIPWSSLLAGAGILAAWSAVLYSVAVGVFRRRELATYSGQ